MTEPAVRVTEYEVSLLPVGHEDNDSFAILVQLRDEGRWAVLRRRRWCLGVDGTWDMEMIPSEREDEWIASHRFALDEALRLAKLAAPDVKVNGRNARQAAEELMAETQP